MTTVLVLFRRTPVVLALLASLILLAPSATPARGLTLPGGLEVTVDQQNLSLFTRYSDWGACQAAYFTNCFRFEDGTVVGQLSALAPLIPLLNAIGVSWSGCTKVMQMGASPNVVEVYAGAGVPLIVGAGECGSLPAQLAAGSAYLVVPGIRRTIAPTVASVLELDVAHR